MKHCYEKLNIMHTNIKCFNSKVFTLKNMLKDIDILTVNETKVAGKKRVSLPGYKTFLRNRICNAGGGIATFVSDKICKSALKVSEGTQNNEFIITRHGQFSPPINVLNIYGPQESKTGKDILD